MTSTLRVVSFRVECRDDLLAIKRQLAAAKIIHQVLQENPDTNGFPDIEVELQVNSPVSELQRLMGHLPDMHVARDTLRECPLTDNPLIRT